MDDSKIWYYIALGAIYFLSKMLKKKKTEDSVDNDEYLGTPADSQKPKSKTPAFEDIFKELTGETATDISQQGRTQPLKPVPQEPILATELAEQASSIYDREGEEFIDTAPHKPIEREKPTFDRTPEFQIEEEGNELHDEVHDFLGDHEGLRKALVLKEVLERKY